jgi:ribonuclease BN (tRNA processing enzyme)
MELTVLGASGSYGAPSGGACSGYLVREGDTAIWMDCGNGTFANLQRHIAPEDLTAVVITHEHPDHCADVYGLHVLLRYGLEQQGLAIYGPETLEHRLGALVSDWGGTFDWNTVADGDSTIIGGLGARFSQTEHPVPTYAVELTGATKRLIYTADTGPNWSVDAFAPGADLVLSEATYQGDNPPWPLHLTAHQAGAAAREAKARRLMLTHLWPRLDPLVSVEEGSDAFGAPVTLAAAHLVTPI